MEKTELMDLIQKAVSGDSQAFSVLYEEYYSRIYYLCFKLLKNREDAGDITQETFVAAFKSLNTLNNAFVFESWLKSIAANKCKNYLKKSKPVLFSQYDKADGFEFDIEDNKAENAQEIVDNSEIHKIINEIIDRLPDEQRVCIILYYYDEKSVSEIADFLECSEGTVKSRLNYARKKIRDEIEAIEKRDNIQLHSAAAIPLLGTILSKHIPNTMLHPSFSTIVNGAASITRSYNSPAETTFGVTDNALSNAKISLSKKLFKTTASKVIAGVLSAAVLVSGGVFAGTRLNLEQNNLAPETMVNSTVTESTTETEPENKVVDIAGNTSGNLDNCGYAALQGDYIYYCDSLGETYNLYRIKTDGTERKKLSKNCNLLMPFINVVDNYVYYNGYGGIYAVMTDGANNHKISDDEPISMSVVGENIYYSTWYCDENYKSFVMKTDGSNKQKIFDNYIIAVVDDLIYYNNKNDGYKIYAMKTDGSNSHKIIDCETYDINVLDNWIYYLNKNDDDKIYAVKTDGTDNHKVNDDSAFDLNVAGDTIYYSNTDDSNRMYSVKLDGSNKKKLTDEKVASINIAGEWIYCKLNLDIQGGPNYRLRFDGSNREKLNYAG